jgi:uncharacterized damage-inducible protein DinB
VEKIIAFSSPHHRIFGYAYFATEEVAQMDIQKELESEFDREAKRTRKMFEALPEGADFSWKPHAKSMSLGKLAGHVTDMTGYWAMETLTKDKMDLPADHKWEQYLPASKAELLEKFDRELPATRAALVAITPEQWEKHWQFIFGGQVWIDQPRYQVWREMVMNHLVHHRSQLGVYLRLLDAKIPGTYGPSADES